MPREHFAAYSAAMLFLTREKEGRRQLLLQKRRGTGWMDGYWECAASGHVEAGESMTMAMMREAEEEMGIRLLDPRLVVMAHCLTPDTGEVYFDGYFTAEKWEGVPHANEPDKCEEVRWFDEDALPENVIPSRLRALAAWRAGKWYIEEGWEDHP